jgi:hypothetical protein
MTAAVLRTCCDLNSDLCVIRANTARCRSAGVLLRAPLEDGMILSILNIHKPHFTAMDCELRILPLLMSLLWVV